MDYLALILNVPYSLACAMAGVVAGIRGLSFSRQPFAIVMRVRKMWWNKHVRASTAGNVILVTPKVLPGDLEHEYVHVHQYNRLPFIFPWLYMYQTWRYGYRQNKYEVEAYQRAGNKYISK